MLTLRNFLFLFCLLCVQLSGGCEPKSLVGKETQTQLSSQYTNARGPDEDEPHLLTSPEATGNGHRVPTDNGYRRPLWRVPIRWHHQFLSFRGKLGSDVHGLVTNPAFRLSVESKERLANVPTNGLKGSLRKEGGPCRARCIGSLVSMGLTGQACKISLNQRQERYQGQWSEGSVSALGGKHIPLYPRQPGEM